MIIKKYLVLLVLFGVIAPGGFAAAGCMVCPNGHVTCHDSGGHPNCGEDTAQPPMGTTPSLSSSIICNSGNSDTSVFLFEHSILELPLGQNPVNFKNIAMPLYDYANISVNPIFHFRQISFETAYCNYVIQVDGSLDKPYVLKSFLTCEGQQHEIQCKIN